MQILCEYRANTVRIRCEYCANSGECQRSWPSHSCSTSLRPGRPAVCRPLLGDRFPNPTSCSLLVHSIGFSQHNLPSDSDDVTLCSGAEPSNANFSFPEHFEGKRQSGEMYQKDCLPLLYTFCKFQRLKDKGSQVMLVCLHQHSRIRAASPTYRQRQQCASSPVESTA